jgi:hypothetical protein
VLAHRPMISPVGLLSKAAAALVMASCLLSGCVTSGSREWGADATWRVSAAQLRAATLEAAKNPHVWVPLAGAALFQIDGWDRKVSNSAREHTPIFGSQQNAEDWSDYLRTAWLPHRDLPSRKNGCATRRRGSPWAWARLPSPVSPPAP